MPAPTELPPLTDADREALRRTIEAARTLYARGDTTMVVTPSLLLHLAARPEPPAAT